MTSLLDKLPPGAGNMLFVMPLLYVSNKIDFKDSEDNLLYLRICFYSCQALTFSMIAMLYFKIMGTSNDDKVKVPAAAPSLGTPATGLASEIMRVTDYDLQQLRKLATQTCMTVCLISFLHFKWELTAPLILQSVMTPKAVVMSPLFKHYFQGQIVVRPFPEEANPLQQLMNPAGPPSADDAPEVLPLIPATQPAIPSKHKAPKKKKSSKAD